MPPRLSFSPAPSQWLPRLFCSTPSASAALHTTSSSRAIDYSIRNANSSIMGIDSESNNDPSRRYIKGQPRPAFGSRGAAGPMVKPNQALRNVLRESDHSARRSHKASVKRQLDLDRLQETTLTNQFVQQMPRRWRPGDAYAPHDLSPEEAPKFRRNVKQEVDLVDALGLNPVDEYRNFSMISEFMTPTGRIMHSKDTGLRPVNQRKMAKAIRRAIGMGLHPSVHRHPEILDSVIRTQPQTIAAKRRPGDPLF